VLLAGVPCDFRLNYGLHINRKATLPPEPAAQLVVGDPADFLTRLSREFSGDRSVWRPWSDRLRTRDREREEEIAEQARASTDLVNPLRVCTGIEEALDDDSILVADGGDFVATASYVACGRAAPLSWLDPGAVRDARGRGRFRARRPKLCAAGRPRPGWPVGRRIGSGYGTRRVRHLRAPRRVPVIAVVGNDASWAQIAREQVELLGRRRRDGARAERLPPRGRGVRRQAGLLLERPGGRRAVPGVLPQAKQIAAAPARPVLVNALIGKTEFRKGSISM
jgi:acetolactate synthase-like protein